MNVTKKIYTDGREEDIDQKWTLKQLQDFVGGYIEMVPSNKPRRSLIVNEDGLGLELPDNLAASKYVSSRVLVLDFIRGNALLVKS